MIPAANTIRRVIAEQSRTQTWVAKKMNEINPEVEMDAVKFSAIATGKRKMSGEECNPAVYCSNLPQICGELLSPSYNDSLSDCAASRCALLSLLSESLTCMITLNYP